LPDAVPAASGDAMAKPAAAVVVAPCEDCPVTEPIDLTLERVNRLERLIKEHFDAVERRFDALDHRLDRMASIEQRLEALEERRP
jgi:hypothetical protein